MLGSEKSLPFFVQSAFGWWHAKNWRNSMTVEQLKKVFCDHVFDVEGDQRKLAWARWQYCIAPRLAGILTAARKAHSSWATGFFGYEYCLGL
jgi:hypothetical protein